MLACAKKKKKQSVVPSVLDKKEELEDSSGEEFSFRARSMTVTAQTGKVGELAPAKPRLIHEDVIDFLLVNPGATGKQVAKHFGMTPQWMYILTNSDAFQRRYDERKKELVDPGLRTLLEDRMKGLMAQSIEVLMEKLSVAPKEETALKALDITTKALGYGAKVGPAIQQNFLVQAPLKSINADAWEAQHSPRSGGQPSASPLPAVGGAGQTTRPNSAEIDDATPARVGRKDPETRAVMFTSTVPASLPSAPVGAADQTSVEMDYFAQFLSPEGRSPLPSRPAGPETPVD